MKSKKNIKVILVGGCFDILHPGHLDFLKKAKSLCDYLIVLLEPDEKVRMMKGINRPKMNLESRILNLKNTKLIDEVVALPILKTDTDYYKIISNIISTLNSKFEILNSKFYLGITKNDRNKIKNEKILNLGKKLGIEVLEVNKLLPEWSTTKLINSKSHF